MKSTLVCVAILLGMAGAACAYVPGQHWEISVSHMGQFDGSSANLWENGWGFGVGVVQDVTPGAQLGVTASVSQHQFGGAGYSVMSPDLNASHLTVAGEESWQYALSVALRTFGGTGVSRGFLAVRAGVTVTDVGAMSSTSWSDDSPDVKSTRALDGSGSLETGTYISIGGGLRMPLGGGRRLLIETAVRLTDKVQFGWVPLMATVQF